MAGDRLGVAFKTLGCKVNQVESEDIASDLLGRGVSLVDEAEASVVVVNTCTVTGEADAKARKAVRHALASPAMPVVVVTGCMAALSREELEALSERVVVEADKALVPDRVQSALQARGGRVAPAGTAPGVLSPRAGFRTRAMLKVEDGCDAFCTYCIVPHARGGPRPVPLARIEAEAAALVASGVREIVLTGVNLGRYADAGRDLSDVLVSVALAGVERLRVSSIEPLDLTERFLATLASLPAACPHLHVPLQSGSDTVLAAMGRRYTCAQYAEAIDRARTALPGLAVTTDVIAGFPGETDADHAATEAACRGMGFAKLHVFRYSERSGTPAASMPGGVPRTVRGERAALLRGLDDELQRAFRTAHLGETVSVLVERSAAETTPHGGVEWSGTGTTPDYLKVSLEAGAPLVVGEVVPARVVDAAVSPVRGVVSAPGAGAFSGGE